MKIKGVQDHKFFFFNLTCILFFMGSGNFVQTAVSQGMTNINVTGIPSIIDVPFTDQFERNFRNGRYQVIFTYTNNSTEPVDFRFRFRLTRDGEELLEIQSDPESFRPGAFVFTSIFDELLFPLTFEEVLDQVDSDIRKQIIQEGTVPEGRYVLNIQAIPEEGSGTITSIQSITPFTVRFPQPPILINPADMASISLATPVFNWTPVAVRGFPIQYDFLLVEVLDNQTPFQAINSNRAHAERSLTNQNILVYTPEFLPLEEGQQYAWRVTVSSMGQLIPFKDDGESVIHTFVYSTETGGDESITQLRQLDSISLIPDFASLIRLDDLEVTETNETYLFNGSATLALEDPINGTVTSRVEVTNLEIQKQPLNPTVVLGGSLQGNAPDLTGFLGESATVVQADDIEWDYNRGVTVTANIVTPDGSVVKAGGSLSLSAFEVRGSVAATAETNESLITIGEHPFIVQINSISADYPGDIVQASGRAAALGDLPCELPSMYLQDDKFTGYLDCDLDKTIPLVEESELIRLRISDFTGNFEGKWEENIDLAYTVSIRSSIELKTGGTQEDIYCGASGVLRINDETGLEAGDFSNNCSLPDPSLDLGFLNMSFSDLELSMIDFNGDEGWDFELFLDAELFFPPEADIKLPTIEDIAISPEGISFPEISFDEDLLQPYTTIGIDQFRFSLTDFSLRDQLFPWFEWNGGAGPWDFSFDANVQLPNYDTFPACIRNSNIALSNAELINGRVQGSLQATLSGDCRWEFGQGYAFDISSAAGSLWIAYDSGTLIPEADFNFDGIVELGIPFLCETPDDKLERSDMAFSVNEDGLSGEINNVVPSCPLNIGPYSATISNSDLMYSISNQGRNTATLSGTADLNLGIAQSAEGTFALNLITGEFTDLDFELDGPFEWGIPKDNPVLVFNIDAASVTEEGLYIDGRQSLNLDEGESMGVTFDDVVIDWQTFEIQTGQIVLDESISFEAGIDSSTRELSYAITQRDSVLSVSPGVFFKLGGTVIADSLGLHATGSSLGELNFGDFEIDNMNVQFSEDFAFHFEPFGVGSGQAEFFWNDQRIAMINSTGFVPDFSFFGDEFLPERIPLPTKDIAYLQIKENGKLLVQTNRVGNGAYLVETLPGEILKLVIPALQGSQPQPPSIEVSINNLLVNPSTGNYISGTVTADIPDGSPLTDLSPLGVPLSLEEIVYSTRQINGNSFSALFLEGKIQLFNHEFGENGRATLFMRDEGRVQGTVTLSGINEEISMDNNDGLVILNVDSLNGNMDIPVLNPLASKFVFDLAGNFEIRNFQAQTMAEAGITVRYNQNGFFVNNFNAGSFSDGASFDMGSFMFAVDEISSLGLNYTPENGFQYSADLDLSITMQLSDGESIRVPLKNVDIRSGTGIVIPAQEIHDGSLPALDAPAIDFGMFRLTPLAFRMERDTLDIHNFRPGDLLDFIPEVDLELTFPAFASISPDLSGLSLTINAVRFEDGRLTGSVVPYDVVGDPIFLPIGPAGIYIDGLGGGLTSTEEGGQQFDLQISGFLGMPDFFSNSTEACNQTRVSFALSSQGGVRGAVNDFQPCGSMGMGPLRLAFGPSVLTLDMSEGEQKATLDGTGTVEIERENQPPVSAAGNLVLDLLKGDILSGSLQITDPFTWHLPSENPLFSFMVQSASLGPGGLLFDGTGSLQAGDGSISADFNQFTLSLTDGKITDGFVDISNQFAIDISFNPTTWNVTDPDNAITYDSGVRFMMPSNLRIDKNGTRVTGQSSASLRYAEEVYDGLNLDFVDLSIGFEPVGVDSGRADLLLDDDGTVTRLAYYDSRGFHLDNFTGAIAMPDTLGLPTKDIAYIVLKDDQGNNLVQSQSVEGGLELSTSRPVPLVLAGLAGQQGTAPRVDVSFSNVVINNAFEIISGSITADVSATPLNLPGTMPIGLTAIHFEKLQGQPYKMYADAKLNLPESLSDLEIMVNRLVLASDGFEHTVFSVGEYSVTHTESVSEAIAGRQFADGAFQIFVRGAELNFGSTPSYRFSGDLKSSFVKSSQGDTTNIHFSAVYRNAKWNFTLDSSHIVPQELPIGNARLFLDNLTTENNQNEFNLVMDGRLNLDELAGEDFEVGITGLRIGTGGVSVDQVDTDGLTPQSMGLFGESDNITISDFGLTLQNNHLMIDMDGELQFLDRTFAFNNFKIGTDGTFELGDGNVNLISSSNGIPIMDKYLVLTSLMIKVENNRAVLAAEGRATLPEPFTSSAVIGFSVDHRGGTSVTGPSFNLNESSVKLGDFADLNLKDVGLHIESLRNSIMTLYASADIDIDGNIIQFGSPGSYDTWGIRYAMADPKLEWNLTGTPDFEFETGFLKLSIQNASLTDEEAGTFGVSIDANAKLLLDGVDGAGLELNGFTITPNGIGTLGKVQSGNFSLADAVDIEVGGFEWGQNKEITVIDQSRDGSVAKEEISQAVDKNVTVDEYLRFASDDSNAVSISMPGSFKGDVQEIFYYRKGNSFYLNIEDADINLNDYARLYASFEYENSDAGIALKVAGGGDVAGSSINALGRVSTLNDEFSFGIFVSVQTKIPVLPGVLTLTEAGGGFFYKASNQDFEDVRRLTDYTFYNDRTPWEDQSGNYDFAVMLYAGAGIVEMGGSFAVNGKTMIILTDQWFAMDAQGHFLGESDELKAGMYLTVQWAPVLNITGRVGVTVDYGFLVEGDMGLSFFLFQDQKEPPVWGVDGHGELSIIGGVAWAKSDLIISDIGFYVGVEVGTGFDVWVISVSTKWEGSIWWIYGEQFGAYVEINFEATLFKVATIGATLKGALIIDDNGYLVYASASAYVKVLFVFEGRVSVWVSMRNGNLKGGKGSNSQYESMISDARQQAQNMNDRMNEIKDALEKFKSLPTILKISDDVLAAAGVQLVGFQFGGMNREMNAVIGRENQMIGSPQLHQQIKTLITAGGRKIEGHYNISELQEQMNRELDNLETITEQVEGRFEESYELALEWQEESIQLVDDLLTNPVQNVQNQDTENSKVASFSINANQATNNQQSLEQLKTAIDQLDQKYAAAIDSVTGYINRIDQALSRQTHLRSGLISQTEGLTGDQVITSETGGLEITTEPSANRVSSQYLKTVASVDKFYGEYVAQKWQNWRWAQNKLTEYAGLRPESMKTAVINSNTGMLQNLLPQWNINYVDTTEVNFDENLNFNTRSVTEFREDLSDDRAEKISQVAATRSYAIYNLAPNSGFGTATKQEYLYRQKMYQWALNDKNSFFLNFIQTGVEFWYKVPVMGYRSIRDTAFTQTNKLLNIYREGMDGLEGGHQEFTALIDDIYKIKTSLTLTLHGMVDLYAAEKAGLAGDSAAADILNLKEELEQILTPPRISDINVTKSLDDFNNKVTLSWIATHPSGQIVENSYILEPGSNPSVVARGLLSTGSQMDVTRYLFKENLAETQREMRVVVRARGPAGTTISRPAILTVSLDKEQGGPESTGVSEKIDYFDNTPPSMPTVTFDYGKNETQSIAFENGVPRLVTAESYWTNNSEEIEFSALSFDAESDIAAFEYAVGSREGITDIVEWTRVQGERTMDNLAGASNNSGLSNARQKITIRNLDVSSGPHYLSVRAINGTDRMSNTRHVTQPVRYDSLQPSAPQISAITQPGNLDNGNSIFLAPTKEVPELEQPPTMTRYNPTIRVELKQAIVGVSGIESYEYVLSHSSDPNIAFEDIQNVQRSRNDTYYLKGGHLSYHDSVYVHARAVNGAGTIGKAATSQPFIMEDKRRPLTPKIMGAVSMVSSDSQKGSPYRAGIFITRPSIDPETGIDHYEYILKRGNVFYPNLFDWRNLAVSKELNNYSDAYGNLKIAGTKEPSFVKVPLQELSPGDNYTVGLRAVNTQGLASGAGYSGTMVYDMTPPVNPTISLSKNGNTMTIQVSNIYDPESGVDKVEYMVYDTDITRFYGQELVPWTDFISINRTQTNSLNGSVSVNISGRDYYKLKVSIRVTNKNGLQTIVSKILVYVFNTNNSQTRQDYQITIPGF